MKSVSLTFDGVMKPKTEDSKPPYHPSLNYLRFLRRHRCPSSSLLLLAALLASFSILLFFFSSSSSSFLAHRLPSSSSSTPPFGGRDWERQVRSSARPRARNLTVLVTGAAGFVGAHACLALRRRGDGVLGLDSFAPSYYDPSLKRSRQALLLRHGVFVVDGDLNNPQLLAKVFDVAPAFTHVLHLAAQPGVRHALRRDPSPYVSSNVAALVSLLERIKNADPMPALVWASSSSVYGLNSPVGPSSESDRTDRPASLYAATKKAGEEITHAYNHIYGVSVTALRLFSVYGPWGRPDMAYYSFTRDILRGRPVKVYEGSVRDFTYVNDIVRGCLAALDTAKGSTGSGGRKRGNAEMRTYNLGSATPVPVAELVDVLERVLGVKAVRKVVPMPRNGDVLFTHANITLARRDLGYEPATDLKTGLKRFVRWYRSYYTIKKNS
ncbi:putative UDP-glucuronate 4-epimerase 3 [Iris pallida]|uniref:UDP-glucuronate 4-epimerase 3 n=1 Tax=Iris pallida TaxID=29817 RepID=A0AAX6G0D8_IRIPA|nr:putative UDP-glucuronate 4-epimerase 3 [Iris pallida]